jgi:hypothetical protein
MSEDAITNNADLKAQYAERLDADLEGNAKEQERISSEIATLQEQLRVLEGDRTLLLSMRQAISEGRLTSRRGSNRRENAEGDARAGVRPSRRSATRTGHRNNEGTSATTGRGRGASPVLRVLAAEELAKHSQPRTAAEITNAMAQSYPERRFIDQVVRNTLENLVARGEVKRIKQQRSVFYTIVNSAVGESEPQFSGTAAAV